MPVCPFEAMANSPQPAGLLGRLEYDAVVSNASCSLGTGLAEHTGASRAHRLDDPADICQYSEGTSRRPDEMEG